MLCLWLLNLLHKMNIMQMKKLRKVFQRSPAVNLNYIITEEIHNYIASYSNPRLLPHHILTRHIRFPPPTPSLYVIFLSIMLFLMTFLWGRKM